MKWKLKHDSWSIFGKSLFAKTDFSFCLFHCYVLLVNLLFAICLHIEFEATSSDVVHHRLKASEIFDSVRQENLILRSSQSPISSLSYLLWYKKKLVWRNMYNVHPTTLIFYSNIEIAARYTSQKLSVPLELKLTSMALWPYSHKITGVNTKKLTHEFSPQMKWKYEIWQIVPIWFLTRTLWFNIIQEVIIWLKIHTSS